MNNDDAFKIALLFGIEEPIVRINKNGTLVILQTLFQIYKAILWEFSFCQYRELLILIECNEEHKTCNLRMTDNPLNNLIYLTLHNVKTHKV